MIPPHLKGIATLPSEICVQEITMLKHWMNKVTWKTQTAMQDSSTKNCSRKKYSSTDVSVINLLMRRYLPSNTQNNSLYTAAATKKKAARKSFRTSSPFSQSL